FASPIIDPFPARPYFFLFLMDKIKQELLESYRSHGGINHMDGPNLPSRESVDLLATDFMHLLFAGYFEKRTLTKQEFDEALEERLQNLRRNLTAEIAKCIQCKQDPAGPTDAEQEALHILRCLP